MWGPGTWAPGRAAAGSARGPSACLGRGWLFPESRRYGVARAPLPEQPLRCLYQRGGWSRRVAWASRGRGRAAMVPGPEAGGRGWAHSTGQWAALVPQMRAGKGILPPVRGRERQAPQDPWRLSRLGRAGTALPDFVLLWLTSPDAGSQGWGQEGVLSPRSQAVLRVGSRGWGPHGRSTECPKP